MVFAHMADLHIGGWPDERMTKLGLDSFKKAVSICIEKNVEFILFSGDLFNTALPQIDYIKEVAAQLKLLKDNNIKVYSIAGSHDYSPSGKTMLEVFEKAGLLVSVTKFDKNGNLTFTDINGSLKVTGMYGKKGGLEKTDYSKLDLSLLDSEPGKKIFMFHTAITELNPAGLESMDSQPLSSLPRSFNYYAGGHVHYIFQKEHGNGILTFPGALFPNNFKELEEYKHGGFYIVDDNFKPEYVPIKLKDVICLNFNADNKSSSLLMDEIIDKLSSFDITDKIILLRVEGKLSSGKPSDIKFNRIIKSFSNAYYIAKNISNLKSSKFEEIEVKQGTVKEVEESIVLDYNPSLSIPDLDFKDLSLKLMQFLDKETIEGEKKSDFEKRLFSEVKEILKLNEIFS
ncbi:hypothetical protein D6777_00555 [Candidatus Woesearchaeota archaeon]|nr:MAG: hypothetical protein D6777_00555 [Candidatus Woesearchaeota archaeon]